MKTSILLSLVCIALIISSCGPGLATLTIDVRIPAKYDIKFGKKNIAIFTTISPQPKNVLTAFYNNDSLLMVNFSLGLARTMERRLSLPMESIPTFNHYTYDGPFRDSSYISSLASKSGSEIIIIVDDILVGDLEDLPISKYPLIHDQGASFVFSPSFSRLNLYSGLTKKKIATVDQNDTIFWELKNKQERQDSKTLSKVYEMLTFYSKELGKEVAFQITPKWQMERRSLYIYQSPRWISAYMQAVDFKWEEATEMWLSLAETKDKQKSAAAAYNLAVACEMTEKFDLALEWIEYAEKQFPLQNLPSYKKLIKQKLEERK